MLNKIFLIGRLGRRPEMRRTPSGLAVCSFYLATDRRSGEVTTTTWHRVVTFDRLAENCELFLNVGSMVFLEGEIRNRDYEDRDGIKRTVTEVVARNVKFLSGKSESRQPAGEHSRDESCDDLPF